MVSLVIISTLEQITRTLKIKKTSEDSYVVVIRKCLFLYYYSVAFHVRSKLALVTIM